VANLASNDIPFLNGAYSLGDVNGSLTFGGTFTAAQAIGSLPGPAVPEPASWDIFGAGLGCLSPFFIVCSIVRAV